MAPKKSKARSAKAGPKSSRRGAKLAAKRCPKPGLMVSTRAGLIGVTTGECERRKVDVALMGQPNPTLFTRGELRKVPKGQQARIQKDLSKTRARQPVILESDLYASLRAAREKETRQFAPDIYARRRAAQFVNGY